MTFDNFSKISTAIFGDVLISEAILDIENHVGGGPRGAIGTLKFGFWPLGRQADSQKRGRLGLVPGF